MLTCPPSRINLTAADLSDFQQRWAGRRPARSTRPPPSSARLSVGAAHLTKLGYVPASANLGRKRAESCSSQATICTAADDQAIHSGDEDTPFAGPSQSPIGRLPERAATRAQQAVGHGTCSISDSIETTTSPLRSPQKPPAHFTLHEEAALDQAKTEATQLRNPQIFRRAAVDTVLQHLATTVPELVRLTDYDCDTAEDPADADADALLNPALDPGAPVFVPRTRFGTVANHSSDNSHGGIRLDGFSTTNSNTQAAHLRARSSFERNSQVSSHGSEQTNASSNRLDAIAPVRVLQTRRRSRTQDQNAATQRLIPDLDRYPAMPALPPGVGMNGRRSSATHRRSVLPRRRSSRAHMLEFERARMGQLGMGPALPSQRAELRAPDQERLRPVSPAPSSSSRSTPNLLWQGVTAPVVHPRSSSFSWRRAAYPDDTQSSSIPTGLSHNALSSRTLEDNYLNRDSPLEELAKQLSRLVGRPRSVGRSLERPPGAYRPSLLNGDPFRLESPERSIDRPPTVMSPPRQGTTPVLGLSVSRGAVQQAIGNYQRAHEAPSMQISSPHQTSIGPGDTSVHRSQTQSSLVSAFEDPVAFALALPPETIPLSPASTPLPSSPGSPSSAYLPSTPPVYSSPASPHHSSASRSSMTRSSINRIPQSLDAVVTPKVTIYKDDKSPTTQPQTPADVTRSGRRFRPRSDTGSMYQSAMTTLVETPSHAAMERNPHRNTYPTNTPSHHDTAQYDHSGLTPARQYPPGSAQRPGTVEQRRRGFSENEMEPHLGGLEQDRRIWISRQEQGNLDVTPPREGRYERYLS